MGSRPFPMCQDRRKCFARTERGQCKALSSAYPDGECPFCKPDGNVTNGKRYLYDLARYSRWLYGRGGETMREQCLQEMVMSLVFGGIAAIIAFSSVFQYADFTVVGAIAFLIGTWYIGTYCAWSLIDWTERWCKWRRKRGH